jgi:hypothetical protein
LIEFDCEGCGWHVIAVGLDRVPKHGFCATCAWMQEFITDPEEMMRVRKWMDPECSAIPKGTPPASRQ